MAEEFIDQLCRAQNRVSSKEKHECIICKEDCGTKNPDNGLVEYAVRLPSCHHIVGSACITRWLQSSNTCPICRHVLFPAQPRREQILNSSVTVLNEYLTRIRRLCDDFCAELHLEPGTPSLVSLLYANLIDPASTSTVLQNQSDNCVLAVSIYIASHLIGHPRSPREISAVIDNVRHSQIRTTYNLLTNPREFIDSSIRYELRDIFNIHTLDWPPQGIEPTTRETGLEYLINLCSNYCTTLGRSEAVCSMAQLIASRAWSLSFHRHPPRSSVALSAACVFMAGHLMDSPRSLGRVSQTAGVGEDKVVEVYRALYSKRKRILQKYWLRDIGRHDMESALARLPAL